MDSLRFERILCFEPDAADRRSLVKILKPYAEEVLETETAADARAFFEGKACDLVIAPLQIEGMRFNTEIQRLRAAAPFSKQHAPFILTSQSGVSYEEQALLRELGAVGHLCKPILFSRTMSQVMETAKDARRGKSIELATIRHIAEIKKAPDLPGAIARAVAELVKFHSDGSIAISRVLEAAGKSGDAISGLNRAILLNQQNTRLLDRLGNLYAAVGDHGNAWRWLQKADEAAPGQMARLKALMSLALTRKNEDGILKYFSAATALNILTEKEITNCIDMAFHAGMPTAAARISAQSRDKVELIRLFNNRGIENARTERYADAIREYEKALCLAEDSTFQCRILFNMALAHVNLKTPDSVATARRQLEETLRRNPSFVKAREVLGRMG